MKKQVPFRLEEEIYDKIRIKLITEKKYPSFQKYLETLIDEDLKRGEANENNGNSK